MKNNEFKYDEKLLENYTEFFILTEKTIFYIEMNKERAMTDLQKIKEMGFTKVFKADEWIFRQGDPGDEMYIVLSGRVGLYINAANGLLLNISHLENGDFLGEIALLENAPRNAAALAETDTTVIAITRKNFRNAICHPDSIPYRIMEGLVHQVNQVYNQLSLCKDGDITLAKPACLPAPAQSGEESRTVSPALIETENNLMIKGYGHLYPDGHQKYPGQAPAVHNDYLISAHAICPVCSDSFEAKKQYLSKLKFAKMDHDFRKHYTDFEPLWYSLWVCPHCLYTNYYTEYNAIPTYKKQNVLARTQEIKKQLSFKYSEPRTLDEVFTAYYLALVCAELYNASSMKFAKIWLQLSWLYHDAGDEAMFMVASDQALKNYYDVLYKTTENLSIEQAQQCFILLGELYLIKGNEKEALRHFYTAIKKDGGRESFNQQAEGRIHDIRKGT